jgi:D-alanyl-D-alanine carboxypeptidase (penicillin-binding protein 5/6)
VRARAATAAAALICGALALSAAPAGARAQSPPKLAVTSAALYAPATGQMLYGVNANRERPIASTTKLMTALIVLQRVHNLHRVFTYPNYHTAAADSQIGLQPGERMTVHDLLVAMMLPSADDAAEDLAYNVGHGSVGAFVAMMNREARKLGLRHTHYTTPIGLDTPGNYSSAHDLLKLAGYIVSHNRFFARVIALPRAVLRTGARVRVVTNRNDLVAKYPWVTGVKTGHTSDAGYVLVGSGRRHGMALLSAVLGTSSEYARDANTLALLGYGFDNFRIATPVRRGQVLARPTVRYRSGVHADVVAAATVRRVVPRGARLTVRTTVPSRLQGPLKRGAIVGRIVILDRGRTLARVPLVLRRALAAVSPLTIAAQYLLRPITLVILVALLLALVGLAGVWRWRARERAAARPEAA